MQINVKKIVSDQKKTITNCDKAIILIMFILESLINFPLKHLSFFFQNKTFVIMYNKFIKPKLHYYYCNVISSVRFGII